MRKLKEVLALAEADRQAREREQAPILRQWTCGEIEVTVDAALRIVIVTADPYALVASADDLIAALRQAREFVSEAERVVAAALIA
ncbi:MAG TPA: hypothetical protein VGI58_09010 [Streptosporangiaceae bacterium]|jgi:hypothetical protein